MVGLGTRLSTLRLGMASTPGFLFFSSSLLPFLGVFLAAVCLVIGSALGSDVIFACGGVLLNGFLAVQVLRVTRSTSHEFLSSEAYLLPLAWC